jgi:hypothetical protein
MSTLSFAPNIVSAASGDLQNIGSALRDANATAAARTTLPPPYKTSWPPC